MCVEAMASFDCVPPNSSHTPHFVLAFLPQPPTTPPLPLPPSLLPHPSLTQSVCLNSVATVYFAVHKTTFQEKDSVSHVMVHAPQVRGVLQTGVTLTSILF